MFLQVIALFAVTFFMSVGAAAMPGPVSTAIVSESARRGFVVGPLVASGHAMLDLVLVLLMAAGLSAGLNTPLITVSIALLGGGMLLWMGGTMVTAALRNQLKLPRPDRTVSVLDNWRLFGLGVGMSLSNPFWYIWWLTVGAAYVVQGQQLGWGGVAAFYFGHIGGDYAWDTLLSAVVGGSRRWLTDGVYKWLIVVCGGYLLYLGGTFIASVFVA